MSKIDRGRIGAVLKEAAKTLHNQHYGLYALRERHYITGSRAIGGWKVDSDLDVLVLPEDLVDYEARLKKAGFSHTPNGYHDPNTRSWKIKTKPHDLNIIVCLDERTFDRWVTATKIARALNLREKSQRVNLFDIIARNVFSLVNYDEKNST